MQWETNIENNGHAYIEHRDPAQMRELPGSGVEYGLSWVIDEILARPG
jgi:hypothetical protein